MATARFKINGTPAEPRGFDANWNQVLTFELEDPPGPDIWLTQYFVNVPGDAESPQASISGVPGSLAPALTLSPASGIPATPTGQVTITFPASGVHTYEIRCVINGGVDPATGKVKTEWTFSRIICKRSSLGIRKELPGERTEYAVRGWSDEQNRLVDALTGSGGTVDEIPPGSGDWTGPIGSNVVERIHGATVPIAGALTPGNVLKVSAAAALIYGAVNLAGGNDHVTGRLPIDNIAFGAADTVLQTNAAGNGTEYEKIANANVSDNAGILVSKLDATTTDGFVITRVGGVATWAAPGFGPGSLTPGAVGQWLVTIDNDPGAGVTPLASWQTPAGDWDGPFGATAVRAMTGTAGVMALHGDDLRWDVDSTPTIGQAARTTDAPTHALSILGQAPWASATGANRNSPAVLIESPAPAAGGAQGRVALRIAATDVLAATAVGALTLFGSPTWTTGNAAPTSSEPEASLYSRTGGANGSLWGREAGAWVRYLASGTGLLAGDATGPAGANVVERIRGTAVVTAGGTLTAGWSLRATDVATSDWGPIDLANPNAITGLLAVTNLAPSGTQKILIIDATGVIRWADGAPGSTILAGDVTGPNTATTVIRINGASVPVSGSLVTGNVLQVTGPATLAYAPINLAGGDDFVTGALPLTNLSQGGAVASDVMAWDTTGPPQWKPRAIGTILPPSASAVQIVADMPALAALDAVPLQDVCMCIVQTPRRVYHLDKNDNTTTADGDDVVAAVGGGRWKFSRAA